MTDIRAELEQKSMNGFQIFVVAVMTFLNALDGFDVLSMTFAGQLLKPEWGLDNATFGWLVSAGLIGMMAGSLFIAPFADKYGRRAITMLSLILVTVGMFASALTQNFTEMFATRLVTGLGIGAMLASIASFTAEYANAKQRSLCIAIMAIGYPLGGTLGGITAYELVNHFQAWEPIFIFGGICSLVVIPLIWFGIPDSFAYLADRRPKNALEKANKVLPRLGLPKIDAMPEQRVSQKDADAIYKTLTSKAHLASLVKITAAYFLFAWVLYFALSWLPQILTQAGFSPAQGISGSVYLNGGGVIGGLMFGAIAGKFGGLRNTLPAVMLLGFITFALFGFAPTDLAVLSILGAVMGFFLIAIVSGLYATYPVIFPAPIRTTGTGIVIGIGRIGGILSPIVAGYFMDASMNRVTLLLLMASPLLIALVLLRLIPELNTPAARGKIEASH